jgi:hypothetical protein
VKAKVKLNLKPYTIFEVFLTHCFSLRSKGVREDFLRATLFFSRGLLSEAKQSVVDSSNIMWSFKKISGIRSLSTRKQVTNNLKPFLFIGEKRLRQPKY